MSQPELAQLLAQSFIAKARATAEADEYDDLCELSDEAWLRVADCKAHPSVLEVQLASRLRAALWEVEALCAEVESSRRG